MKLPLLLAVGILAGAACGSAAEADVAHANRNFFENEIRPLLAKHCYECHGDKKQKSGLRLDSAARFAKGGDSGVIVVAGNPEKSLFIQAVRRTDPDLAMPPDDPLPAVDVAKLEKWVALGAPWPASPDVAVAGGAAVDEHGFTQEQRAFWTFQPLANPKPPVVAADAPWVRGDIDCFIAAKHAEKKLAPAPEAGREEFARRIYFDLHGLPPTAEQMQAFVGD